MRCHLNIYLRGGDIWGPDYSGLLLRLLVGLILLTIHLHRGLSVAASYHHSLLADRLLEPYKGGKRCGNFLAHRSDHLWVDRLLWLLWDNRLR